MCYKGYKHTAKARAKMSATRKVTTLGVGNNFYGKQHTEEWKKERSLLYSGEGNPMYGCKRAGTFSAETRYKMGISGRGKKQSPESIMRRTAVQKGKVLSEQTKRKISAMHKNNPDCQKVFFQKGDKNPAWVGGKSFEVYGEAFNKELKDKIRARDNYICQLCFISENGRRHTCHHIDYCKKHTIGGNLILLCHRCNSRVNRNRVFWEAHFVRIMKLRKLNK